MIDDNNYIDDFDEPQSEKKSALNSLHQSEAKPGNKVGVQPEKMRESRDLTDDDDYEF